MEQHTIKNGIIEIDGRVYKAPQLRDRDGQTVQVTTSSLYPASVTVFDQMNVFICQATNPRLWNKLLGNDTLRQQVLASIGQQVKERRRVNGRNAHSYYSVEDWIKVINQDLTEAARHASYEHDIHALEAIHNVAAECVRCLEHHIEEGAEQMEPDFQQALSRLNRHLPLNKSDRNGVESEPAA